MRAKNILSYFLIFTMLGNTSSFTFYYAFAGIAYLFTTTQAYAQATEPPPSNTPKLDELKSKYQLNNPTRNHQSDTIPDKVQQQINNPAGSRDLSQNILNTLSSPSPTRTIPLNQYFDPTNPSTFDSQRDLALNLSKTHGSPSGTVASGASGESISSLNLEYNRKGTRQFVRGADGKLVLKVVDGGDRVSGAGPTDLFSNELTEGHPGYSFEGNKQALYGNNEGIFDEGRATNQNFKDPEAGKSASARGYRAITAGAMKALQQPSPMALLEPSFNTLQNTQDPNLWLTSCSTTTVPSSAVFNSTTTTEHFCQDTGQSNMDFCEVERISYYPYSILQASGASIGSCGPGCIDVTIGKMQDNVYRASCALISSSASLVLNPALEVESVQVVESAIDDHATLKINGTTAWSMINGSPGSSGDLSQVTRCEMGTNYRPTHSGNLFNAISSAHQNDNQINFNFDLLVDDKGEGGIRFKIQMRNPNGTGFGVEIKQYPEGCYDALKKEDRDANPLTGYMEPETINDIVYQCSRSASLPTCSVGEVVGTVLQEQCAIMPESEFFCETGTLEGEKCSIALQDGACPTNFTLDTSANKCLANAQIRKICDETFTLEEIGYKGEMTNMCVRPTDGSTSPSWSCNGQSEFGPYSFAAGSCTVFPEQFYDSDNEIIVTEDELGNELPHRLFIDTATCRKNFSGDVVEQPESFCTFDEYESIEVGDRGYPEEFLSQTPPFYIGDEGNKTWKVNLKNYRCDPTNGRIMCFPDPETGQETCYDWEDLRNLPERCSRYTEDDRCREIARECTEGWLEPISGRCMAETVTYSCSDETVIEFETEREVNTCDSMLPCVGGNCEIGEPEQNDKFVQAMVAGSIIDNIQGDSSCEDPSDPSTCQIFKGEYKYCSWEVTGLGTNCCEEAKGVDILGYITFTRQMLKVNQMVSSGAFGAGTQSAYNTLTSPITKPFKTVSEWASTGLRSATENLFGNADSFSGGVSAISQSIEAALAAVQKEVYSFVYNMLPDALANLIFDAVIEEGTGQIAEIALNDSIGQYMGNIMAVYAVYSMAKLALTLLTACDKHEMDMGIKLAQRQCFKVGPTYCNKRFPVLGGLGPCMQRRQDYCCYSSILARIIVKESYSQLGINPLPFGNKLKAGTPEAEGSCMGLTAEQLSSVDFNAPSMQTALEEWIALLIQSGSIPTETDEQSLTGGTSTVDADCPVQLKPVLFCYIDPESEEQICEHSRDANGKLLYEEVESECIKKVTPGQIWNASDRQTASERLIGEDGFLNGDDSSAQERVMEGNNQLRDYVNSIDCSVTPRPQVCRFGFDPTDN